MVWKPRKGRVDPSRRFTPDDVPLPWEPLEEGERRIAQETTQVRQLLREDDVQSEAAYQELVGRGVTTAFERTNWVAMAQAINPPVVLVSYTVPGEFLFRLERIGFMFSDPIFFQLNSQLYLPWNVEVNGNQIPGLGENNSTPYRVSIGDVFRPFTFEPIWIHGNETVRVVLRTLAAVTIQVNVAARISGSQIRKTSLRLGRGV